MQNFNLSQDPVTRYQQLLDYITSGVDSLRQEPGYDGIAYIEKCCVELKRVLDRLAKDDFVEEIVEQEIEIPTSPLIKNLEVHAKQHTESLKLYQELLNLEQPTQSDLKRIREASCDADAHQITIAKLKRQIDRIETLTFQDWGVDAIANGITYITCLLLQQISTIWDRNVFRFVAFQEYLFNVLSTELEKVTVLIPVKSDKLEKPSMVQKLEWLVDICYSLFFTNHDIASASTVLQVIDEYLYNNKESQLSHITILEHLLENKKYTKLQTVFGDHTIDIEHEILEDMTRYHDDVIPSIQILVQYVVENGKDATFDAVWRKIKGIKGKECKGNEEIVHFLVTRGMTSKKRDWWVRYATCGKVALPVASGASAVTVDALDTALNTALDTSLDTPLDTTTTDSPTSQESPVNQSDTDDLMARFLSLSNKP